MCTLHRNNWEKKKLSLKKLIVKPENRQSRCLHKCSSSKEVRKSLKKLRLLSSRLFKNNKPTNKINSKSQDEK